MKEKRLTFEHGLYILILIFAAFLRFYGLGKIPLSENEAYIANQVLGFMDSLSFDVAPPIFLSFTGFLFSLFGATTFWARFLPATMGTFLTILPLLWKNRIGRVNALIIAAIFSFDPLLVAASRELDSLIISIFILLLLLKFLEMKQWILVSIFSAIYLLCGEIFVLLIIFLFIIILLLMNVNLKNYYFSINYKNFMLYVLVFILTYFFISTLFGFRFSGFSNAIDSLFLIGKPWHIRNISGFFLLLGIPVYSPIIFIFGIIGFIISIKKNNRMGIFAGFYSILAFLLSILNPNREVFDLLLCILPMSFLAAFAIKQSLSDYKQNFVSILLALVLFLFGFFMWFNFASIARNNYSINSNQFYLQIAIIVVVAILMILSVFMVSAGWNKKVANWGTIFAALLLFGFYSIAISWRGTHNIESYQAELWHQSSSINNVTMLRNSINDLCLKATGVSSGVYINNDVGLESLVWELKDFDVQNSSGIEFHLTKSDLNNSSFEEEYRGQSFSYQIYPMFDFSNFNIMLDWLIYRDISFLSEEFILWVPQYLFE